ncbi:hypothetical protein BDY19DRAFT_910350 [Irpex rosettiformis]|uniref:Uncharacterized protein n=1 Tax=Irpex rosettiformis TaxID=378272 RepID=A0ACB8TP61_9APHY|nr:hypothetical protein BDY19DRAFT_910350 [Irpex rosettiformis]
MSHNNSSDNTLARVESSSPKAIPVLTAGELSIEVYIRWKDACKDYFNVKGIAEDKQFRSEKTWLPDNWEQHARNQLTRARQKVDEPFCTWIVKVETMNTVLADTTSYKDKAQLRNHIESLKKMIALDNERIANMDEIRCLTTRPLLSSSKTNVSSTSSFSRTTTTSRTRDYTPALTEAERDLLYKHYGCFKCCRFYAGHWGKDCTDSAPKGSNYRELTEADALRAKKDHDKKRADASKRAMIAAVLFDENIDECTAAAVSGGSPITAGVLGYGSQSEDSDSDAF